jgi:hypothetical protein
VITVGGIAVATVTTSGGGTASVDFRTGKLSGRKLPLDFDPRGEVVEVEDETEPILRNTNDDGSSPAGTQTDERVDLASTGAIPGASGHARLKEKNGVREFSVEVEDVPDGAYDVLIDGVVKGTITVSGGEGEIEFQSGGDDPGPPLDFDPLGALVQVAQGSTIVLTGTMLASAPGVNECTPSEATTLLAAVGPDADAHGDARLRVRDDCERDFRVEVEDLDVGSYELFVDGTLRGTIAVATADTGTRGEVEFDTDPDELGELLLDFDPTGAAIEVRQGGTVFLAGSGGTPGPGTCDVVDVEPDLDNSGADPDAKGKARFRQDADCSRDLRVEIEDLPLGDDVLLIWGIPRGTSTVSLDLGDAKGQIEFDDEPDQPGELLLDFDPRGQLIEIRQDTTVFLSVTLPG